MKVALIVTVLNEEASLPALLDSIAAQNRKPDEVVVVDGGSNDGTLSLLHSYQQRLPLRILRRPGCNISQGRNAAIAASTAEAIVSTDAGVRLSPQWLEELLRPLEEGAEVTSGFFEAAPQSTFEVAMGATVLPLAGEIEPQNFLPSSRSVAFRRAAWEAVGGYPEWLDYCEDVVFDLELRRAGFAFAWAPRAVAHFRPRSSMRSFFLQYYRYARGDGKAGLWPLRHLARYSAYLLGPVLLAGGLWWWPLWALLAAGGAYHLHRPYQRLWSKRKGMSPRTLVLAALWVPAIRVWGDLAKMVGYPAGLWWRLRRRRHDR